jgi:SAM-dependent methyltransferase
MITNSEFISGKKLIGDDYTLDEINNWFNDEKEGYSGVVDTDLQDGYYPYHAINQVLLYNNMPKNIWFRSVLGIGSAFVNEFEPIIDRIDQITILEPSQILRSSKIGTIKPVYIEPQVSGKIDFPDNTFDLVTSFGVLHHIPNVSFVLSEILRILKPNGHFLLREPIISMGDWSKPRLGLTKRERGIPEHIFRKQFETADVKIIHKFYLTCMTSFIQSKLGFITPRKLQSYKTYVYIDGILAKLLKWNIRYHHSKFLHKLAPQSIAFVIRKRL